MRTLAFDTATRATAVALVDTDTGLALEERDDPEPGLRPAHATRLLPAIAALLERSGAGWERIDRIAVGVGPGTFTGLRIGVATARALGQARGLPLTGVSTLQSLALGARDADHDHAVVAAVIDARRREAFLAAWTTAAIEHPADALIAPRAVGANTLGELISGLGPGVLAIGDGAIEFREVLERSGASVPDNQSGLHRVTAINHVRLAAGLDAVAPDRVLPDYLRLPDAEIARLDRLP
jgi:tRNA threonylcarbamoyladenosine biosynthesis protein TsaB